MSHKQRNERPSERQTSRPTDIAGLRAVERERKAEIWQRRTRLTVSLTFYGAVLSVLGLYITLPARLAESADYYKFELVRPEWLPFVRVSVAAVLGGAAIGGGSGSVQGTIIGAVILLMITNISLLARFPIQSQMMIKGFVIILALAINARRNR